MPTMSAGGTGKPVDFLRISDKTPGAILQPQPPPWEKEVKRIGSSVFVVIAFSIVAFIKNLIIRPTLTG